MPVNSWKITTTYSFNFNFAVILLRSDYFKFLRMWFNQLLHLHTVLFYDYQPLVESRVGTGGSAYITNDEPDLGLDT